VELVSYYKRHPLYRKVKLWYPVNEDFMRGMNVVSGSYLHIAVVIHLIYRCSSAVFYLICTCLKSQLRECVIFVFLSGYSLK
jgi:hypothetical protein